jgi:tetratricopeptide (TPR) repeat protein
MTISQPTAPPAPPAKFSAVAWDHILTLLAIFLAFSLASTPVRDSEIWRHLATGRAICSGDGGIHSDPFTYTQADIPWINRTWLSDVVHFNTHSMLGDGLVLLKAAVVAVIAGLMIAAGGTRRGVAVGATMIGLAAMGPHLALRPELWSGLFFAFTLFWLQRPISDGSARSQLRADGPLLLGFALWANFDEWSLLGPALVGLYAAFEGRRWPTFAVGLLCCLLNPHHIHGLALPLVELTATWPRATWDSLSDVACVPHSAFGLLVALSAVSLVANRTKFDAPDALAWLALLIASFWCEPAKMFFAILAGPMAARNFVDWRFEPRTRRRRIALQTAGVLMTLGLIGMSLPGWLQGRHEAREWRLIADPSLQRMAEQLGPMVRKVEPGLHWLPLSMDAAHHVEWFAPGIKVFADGRRGFFTDDTLQHFRTLREQVGGPGELIDRWKIVFLLAHDSSDRNQLALLQRAWSGPWTAVAQEGRAVLFLQNAWVKRANFESLDLTTQAFRPDTTKTSPDEAAERAAPSHLASLFPASNAGRLDEGEALTCIAHFESQRTAYLKKHKANWEALQIGAMVAAILPGTGLVGPGAELALHARLLIGSQRGGSSAAMNQFAGRLIARHLHHGDDGPAGSLFLALRGARRALHANPDDALAWLRLGQAYFRLDRHTRERAADLPLLRRLRKVQIVASLQQAVRLDPDLAPAHETLAKLSLEENRLDVALHHLQQQIRLTESAGPRPAETGEQYEARLRLLQADEQALGKLVRERLNQTETLSFTFDAYAKARLAQDKGLARRALQILLRSTYGEFGREGALLELELLLMNGQIDDVKSWVEPAQEPVLGTSQYCWLNTLLGAVSGEYARADAALMRTQSTLAKFEVPEAGLRDVPPGQAIAMIFAKRLLDEANLQPLAWRDSVEQSSQRMKSLAGALRAREELATLRGLLALEHGDNVTAARHFEEALRDGVSDGALARHFLDQLQRHRPR